MANSVLSREDQQLLFSVVGDDALLLPNSQWTMFNTQPLSKGHPSPPSSPMQYLSPPMSEGVADWTQIFSRAVANSDGTITLPQDAYEASSVAPPRVAYSENGEAVFSQTFLPTVTRASSESSEDDGMISGDLNGLNDGDLTMWSTKPETGAKKSSSDDDEDEETKHRKRNLQNRYASRNYRKRKKEYVKSLEEQLAAMALENQRLKSESDAHLRQTQHLHAENLALRRERVVTTASDTPKEEAELDSRQAGLLAHLSHMLNSGAQDSELEAALAELRNVRTQLHSLSTKDLQALLHPAMQAKITMLENTIGAEEASPVARKNECTFWLSVMNNLSLTKEQMKSICCLRTGHLTKVQLLHSERRHLNEDIKAFFKNARMYMVKLEFSKDEISEDDARDVVVEISSKLQLLKKNLKDEAKLLEDTYTTLSHILTPKQEAQMMIKYTKHFMKDLNLGQTLSGIWSAMEGAQFDQANGNGNGQAPLPLPPYQPPLSAQS